MSHETISLSEQIRAVTICMQERRRDDPPRVARGKLSATEAERRMHQLMAVHATLIRLQHHHAETAQRIREAEAAADHREG